MAEKRRRGQNFTIEEKDRLVKLLCFHKDTILNKKTDGCTNEAKNRAWLELTDTFNGSSNVHRTKESLLKVWEKLKTDSKLYYQSSRRNVTGTGGGPSQVKIDPILEQVCALLGRACSGLIGVQDCDANILKEENVPKKLCTYNNQILDAVQPRNIIPVVEPSSIIPVVEPSSIIPVVEPSSIIPVTYEEENIMYENLDTHNEVISQNYSISKTPLWSRRRPRLQQINERSEAVATLCTSFQDVNKKKENIEDLKRQLLEEEIDFKRKLYKLQLQAAEREVEIKTEVLNQLKGRSINIEKVFEVQPDS